jgi:hypothetical protein
MIQATIRANVSHGIFLSGNLDSTSNCKAGVISFPNEQTMGSQTLQGLYEITLREEFAKMNGLTHWQHHTVIGSSGQGI